MNFVWPWIFILLPVPWLLRYSISKNNDQADAIALPPRLQNALEAIQQQQKPNRWSGQLVLRWIAWGSLLVALAQPTSPGDVVVQPATGRAIVLAIDLSGSMERKDFELDGETANRLTVVKRAAGHFISARTGDRVGLVLFGKEAFVASPPTFDVDAVRHQLDVSGIGMAGRATAIGDALGLAIQTLRHDPAAERAIVLLSDGTNNAGSAEPESAAELAASMNIRVHAIALGSSNGERQGYATEASADLDEEALRSIADASGGDFFRATTTAELQSVYTAIDALETAETDSPPIVITRDWRNVALLVLLVSLLLASATPLFARSQAFPGSTGWRRTTNERHKS